MLRAGTNNVTSNELGRAVSRTNQGLVRTGVEAIKFYPPLLAPYYARKQNEFWGIIAARPESPESLRRAAQAGAGTVRLNVSFYHYRAHGWWSTDEVFRKAAGSNLRILPNLYGPVADISKPWYPGPNSKLFDEYRAFVRKVVARYGNNGRFWKDNPNISYLPPKYWEVWNEPNFASNTPAGNQARPGAYVDFLVPISKDIRSSDSTAGVMLGGLANGPGSNGMPGRDFLKAIYRHPRARLAFDTVSYHPYSKEVSGVKDAVQDVRKIMDANGDDKKPIWITEIGWATSGPTHPFRVSPAKQASNLRNTLGWMKTNKNQLGIEGVIWYFWKDQSQPIGPKFDWHDFAGLLDASGNAKPAFYEFIKITGGS